MPLFHLARRLPERRRRLLTKAPPAFVGKQLVTRRRAPLAVRRVLLPLRLRRYWTGVITRRMTERRVAPITVRPIAVYPRLRRHLSTPTSVVPGFQLVKHRRLPVAEHTYPPLRRLYRRLPLTKFGKVAPRRLLRVVPVSRWVPVRGRFVPLTAAKHHPKRRLYPLTIPPLAVYPRWRRMLLIAVKLMPLGWMRRPQTAMIPPPLPQRRQRLFAIRGHGPWGVRRARCIERCVMRPQPVRHRQPLTAAKYHPKRRLYPLTVPPAMIYPRGRRMLLIAVKLMPLGRMRRPRTVTVLAPLAERRRRLPLVAAKLMPLGRMRRPRPIELRLEFTRQVRRRQPLTAVQIFAPQFAADNIRFRTAPTADERFTIPAGPSDERLTIPAGPSDERYRTVSPNVL